MSKYLIIGGCGFLGKSIIDSINKNGNEIIVFDRVEYKSKQILSYVGNASDIELIKTIVLKNNIDVILYLVSTLIPSSNFESYFNEIDIVYKPINELLYFCSIHNVKFIYFSSGGTIYGSQSGILNEKSPTLPISFYGLSKLQIENLIDFYNRNFGLSYIIIRPSNPYGWGQNIYGKQGLIAVALGKIIRNEPIEVYGDGNNIRDYIYIDDFNYYLNKLLTSDFKNIVVNVGSGIGYSIYDVINCIESITQKKFMMIKRESRVEDVKSIVMDITFLQKNFPYKQNSLQEGIEKFYKKLLQAK